MPGSSVTFPPATSIWPWPVMDPVWYSTMPESWRSDAPWSTCSVPLEVMGPRRSRVPDNTCTVPELAFVRPADRMAVEGADESISPWFVTLVLIKLFPLRLTVPSFDRIEVLLPLILPTVVSCAPVSIEEGCARPSPPVLSTVNVPELTWNDRTDAGVVIRTLAPDRQTSSLVPGTPFGFQLFAVDHRSLPPPPSQVLVGASQTAANACLAPA